MCICPTGVMSDGRALVKIACDAAKPSCKYTGGSRELHLNAEATTAELDDAAAPVSLTASLNMYGSDPTFPGELHTETATTNFLTGRAVS